VRRGRLTTLSVARVPSRGHANRSTHAYRQTAAKLNRRTDDRRSLTLYGHTKTAEQRTITQKYGDWYTGR